MTPATLLALYNRENKDQYEVGICRMIDKFLGGKPATRRQMRKFLQHYPNFRGISA